jgi:Flp pilus assembly pilin Flp
MRSKAASEAKSSPQAAHSFSGLRGSPFGVRPRGPEQMSPESLEWGTTTMHRRAMIKARKPRMLWGLARSPSRHFRNQRTGGPPQVPPSSLPPRARPPAPAPGSGSPPPNRSLPSELGHRAEVAPSSSSDRGHFWARTSCSAREAPDRRRLRAGCANVSLRPQMRRLRAPKTSLGFNPRSERGQALVEYALVLALVSVVAIAGLTALSSSVQNFFDPINNTVDTVLKAHGHCGHKACK